MSITSRSTNGQSGSDLGQPHVGGLIARMQREIHRGARPKRACRPETNPGSRPGPDHRPMSQAAHAKRDILFLHVRSRPDHGDPFNQRSSPWLYYRATFPPRRCVNACTGHADAWLVLTLHDLNAFRQLTGPAYPLRLQRWSGAQTRSPTQATSCASGNRRDKALWMGWSILSCPADISVLGNRSIIYFEPLHIARSASKFLI